MTIPAKSLSQVEVVALVLKVDGLTTGVDKVAAVELVVSAEMVQSVLAALMERLE